MKKIRGRYPGGPSRGGEDEAEPARSGSPSLLTVEELEGRASRGSQRRRASRRRRRMIVALVAKSGGGWGCGSLGWPGEPSNR